MSRNSRVFTTAIEVVVSLFKIYMSRNSRVFTTGADLHQSSLRDLHE